MLFAFILLASQNNVPFKPNDAFEIKFDLSFKQPPSEDKINSTVHLSETAGEQQKRTSISPQPYLILNVKILKILPEEIRVKVFKDENIQVLNKKTEAGMEFKLDVGFTADVKDVNGCKQVIEFFSEDKVPVSRIVIEFDKEGNYMVNGEKKGRI